MLGSIPPKGKAIPAERLKYSAVMRNRRVPGLPYAASYDESITGA